HAHRDEQALLSEGITEKGGVQLSEREVLGQVLRGEDGDDVVGALQGQRHLVGDAVAGLEVEFLKRGGMACGFEHVGDPFGPLAVLAGAGDEEVEFHEVTCPLPDGRGSERLRAATVRERVLTPRSLALVIRGIICLWREARRVPDRGGGSRFPGSGGWPRRDCRGRGGSRPGGAACRSGWRCGRLRRGRAACRGRGGRAEGGEVSPRGGGSRRPGRGGERLRRSRRGGRGRAKGGRGRCRGDQDIAWPNPGFGKPGGGLPQSGLVRGADRSTDSPGASRGSGIRVGFPPGAARLPRTGAWLRQGSRIDGGRRRGWCACPSSVTTRHCG